MDFGKKLPREEKKDIPQTREEFVASCDLSPHRHIQLIGVWANTVKPDFTTKAQWGVFLKRYLRAAKELECFNDEQISEAFGKLKAAQEAGWLTKFTMETLIKFLI